jgi:hypothetical protein
MHSPSAVADSDKANQRIPCLMQAGKSYPFSQQPASVNYHGPVESSLNPLNVFIEDRVILILYFYLRVRHNILLGYNAA